MAAGICFVNSNRQKCKIHLTFSAIVIDFVVRTSLIYREIVN